jgi:signal transduction histidine kinase
VRLIVRDVGVGLPEQNRESMFDAFQTSKSDGMGIGLFICRSIAELHRGRLWAEPNDGPGATFILSIPRDSRALEDAARTSSTNATNV